MAGEPEKEDVETQNESAPKKGGPLPFIAVGILGTGLGLAVPFLLPSSPAASGHDDGEAKRPPIHETDEKKMTYIPFTEKPIVANLNDGRMTRYVNVAVSLKISKEKEAEIRRLIDQKLPELRDWTVRHLSGKTLDDIRGEAGMNRLRREIGDSFNEMLFPDGYDRIYDVLFPEFAVQ